MDSKNGFLSKTIVGAIIGGLAFYFKGKGVDIDQEAMTQETLHAIDLAVAAFGAVLVVWGRITANKPIHFLPKWLGGGK